MSSADSRETARLQRLLAACRRGLNHDLTNQLVALRGLLQLLEQDEAEHLSPTGRDYVRRLLGVGLRTQTLTHNLRDLARLAAEKPPSEVVALSEVVQEALATLTPAPVCVFTWDASSASAPRLHLRQAVALALPLLAELNANRGSVFDFRARAAGPGIELKMTVVPTVGASPQTNPFAAPALDFPSTWHERLECELLRELACVCGGDARWHMERGGAALSLTLPAPVNGCP